MSNEVALLDDITEDKWPEIYGVGKVNDYYERVKAEVLSVVPDLTTQKGRDAIASNSRKVSTSKTFVEKPGRAYLKYIKETKCAAIEKELREFVDKMDALRDQVRQPLTDYDSEQERIKAEKAAAEAAAEAQRLAEIAARELQEQVDRDHELAIFMYADYLREQEEARKQAVIDAENAAKAQKEREEQIAKEAAESARIAAEKAAAAERQRLADEQARKDAEAKAAVERAEREKVEAENARLRQEQQARDAAAKAEQDAIDAAARAEREKQAAIEAERKRQADAVEAERLETEKRERNKAHVGQKRKEAKESLMAACGVSEDVAKAIVLAIASGKIDNVSIAY